MNDCTMTKSRLQVCFIFLIIFLTACARFDIRRVGRHERKITVITFIKSKEQLVFHLIRKVVMMECANVKIIEIVEGSHATAICVDEGRMFNPTTVKEVPVQ